MWTHAVYGTDLYHFINGLSCIVSWVGSGIHLYVIL